MTPTARRGDTSPCERKIQRLRADVVYIVYCVFVWVFRDWLSHDLMHKTIGDRDRLLLLWGSLSLIG